MHGHRRFALVWWVLSLCVAAAQTIAAPVPLSMSDRMFLSDVLATN